MYVLIDKRRLYVVDHLQRHVQAYGYEVVEQNQEREPLPHITRGVRINAVVSAQTTRVKSATHANKYATNFQSFYSCTPVGTT